MVMAVLRLALTARRPYSPNCARTARGRCGFFERSGTRTGSHGDAAPLHRMHRYARIATRRLFRLGPAPGPISGEVAGTGDQLRDETRRGARLPGRRPERCPLVPHPPISLVLRARGALDRHDRAARGLAIRAMCGSGLHQWFVMHAAKLPDA